MPDCRICNLRIEPFMSFGKMPIANGFLSSEEFKDEYFYELQPAFCHDCGMFQIVEQPDANRMFHENYAFFSRSSTRMVQHFAKYSNWVREELLHDDDPFVVEIGSNDGVMLEHFARAGIRHLGIEPAGNVAEEAERHGINTLNTFFSPEVALEITEKHGKADAVIAANVMCHIPDLNSVAVGVEKLLKADGVLVFEEPYLGDMVEKTSYDQIYDEHVFIFCAQAISNAFTPHGFELINVLPQPTHGGSMRYVLARTGQRTPTSAVMDQLIWEREQGLNRSETFARFRHSCERSREGLRKIIEKIRSQGHRVVGYGATSKSTTIINYCGLSPDQIEFISDTTPIKQGKYSPGAHIPVRSPEEFKSNYPDYAVLFAWNHKAEILEKEKEFMKVGGQWIVYTPEPAVVRG